MKIFRKFWLKSKFFRKFDLNKDISNKLKFFENFDENRNFARILTKIEICERIEIFRKFGPKLCFENLTTIEIFRNFRKKTTTNFSLILTKIKIFRKFD